MIGTLHHVCKVISPGWSFLRRMIDLLCAFRSPHHQIRLNVDFRRDLAWWMESFGSWDGVSFFRMPSSLTCSSHPTLPELRVLARSGRTPGSRKDGRRYTHLCVHYRAGALPHRGSCSFVGLLLDSAISAVPVRQFGHGRHHQHAIEHLTLAACHHHFSFSARHVPGRSNAAADAFPFSGISPSSSYGRSITHHPSSVAHSITNSYHALEGQC